MPDDTFTCSFCKGTFPKAWSDEEAIAESERLWGRDPSLPLQEDDDWAIVCGECFSLMMRGTI